MPFQCRDENCTKTFSTTYNRNKHERSKGHSPQIHQRNIVCIENIYHCPTEGCTVTSKYKANIMKHLKGCVEMKQKRENNKTCPHCQKVFAQKSNRDRHVKTVHNDGIMEQSSTIEVAENTVLPTMALIQRDHASIPDGNSSSENQFF